MVKEEKYYVLIGPGRWGSSDPWLGIPVKWPNISNARVIVETELSHYRIDPSQGTHFFQNLTSFGVAYFTVQPFQHLGFYDLDFLAQQPAIYESEYIRHLHFDKPLVVKVDGKKNIGVIMKP
ncbi:MAG TPA: phosphoenolpyruvate synthase, partial [Paludibacteraceae bacterium]|nr:phosphoenolpyruvate synthase [Paludibacteraceae bacterium]